MRFLGLARCSESDLFNRWSGLINPPPPRGPLTGCRIVGIHDGRGPEVANQLASDHSWLVGVGTVLKYTYAIFLSATPRTRFILPPLINPPSSPDIQLALQTWEIRVFLKYTFLVMGDPGRLEIHVK